MPPASVTQVRPSSSTTRSSTSLWRLRGYLRPCTWRLLVMLGSALLGVVVGLAIPLVTRAIVDGPIADQDSAGILRLGALAFVLGVLEAFLILLRRWIQAPAIMGLETSLRADLCAHLDELPLEFHSWWQSGQRRGPLLRPERRLDRLAGLTCPT